MPVERGLVPGQPAGRLVAWICDTYRVRDGEAELIPEAGP
jgi:hypothetical protein